MLRKAFAKNTTDNIKSSKTQLSKTMQSGGFLDRLLGPLIKTGFVLKCTQTVKMYLKM